MSMRVTSRMMTNHFLSNLNFNMTRMDKYQYQMASNRRIVNISDDPVGVIKAMGMRVKLGRLAQYETNISDSNAWLQQTETSLDKLNEAIKEAYTISVNMVNQTNSQDERTAAAQYIQQMRDHCVQMANSTVSGQYIFGGYNTTTAPFVIKQDSSGKTIITYNGKEMPQMKIDVSQLTDPTEIADANTYNAYIDSLQTDMDTLSGENIQFEIGTSLMMNVSFNGVDLFSFASRQDNDFEVTDNIFHVFNDFYNALTEGKSGQELSNYIERFQNAQNHVLLLTTEIGGRTNRLDMIEDRYSQDAITYTEIKSDVEDIDESEAIMNYKMAEAVYRASLSVGAQIIPPTLLDYLR